MGLGYGSNFPLAKLSSAEVGIEIEKSSKTPFTLFRILTTLVEVGVSLIPGIGAVAETGIALGAGIVNEILDSQSTGISITNTLLNFGLPTVGGAFSGLRNLRGVASKVIGKNLSEIGEVINGSKGTTFIAKTGMTRIEGVTKFSAFNKGLSGARRLGIGQQGFHNLGRELVESGTSRLVKGAIKTGDNLVSGVNENIEDALAKGLSTARFAELRALLEGAKSVQEERSLINYFIRNLSEQEQYRLINATSEVFENLSEQELRILAAKNFNNRYNNFTSLEEIKKLRSELRVVNQELTTRQKIVNVLKRPGSQKFNEHITQKAQWIDPNDLGRAPVEFVYQKLKKSLQEYFKRFAKVSEELEKLEDEFVKGGGILVDSAWHIGYRVIRDLGVNKQVIQITYGKDTGLLKHSFVVASDLDIERYIASPGHYYLNTWAFSKGGQKVSLGGDGSGIFGHLSKSGKGVISMKGFLGFIPAPELRNTLSIVSNWVENVSSMANGNYTSSYLSNFKKSFINTSISRTFRLASQGVFKPVGSNILGKKLGSIIGKETQRIGTQVFSSGIKNTIKGKSFSNGLKSRVLKGIVTSGKSHSLKRLRTTRTNSVVANTISGARRAQFITRIPNAITPGRSALNFQKFKIK